MREGHDSPSAKPVEPRRAKPRTATITRSAGDFPPALRHARALWATSHGDPGARLRTLRAGPTIALVGGTRATYYGREMAGALATHLIRAGVTVVAGTSEGVGAAAHYGALRAGGGAIAAMLAPAERTTNHREDSLYPQIVEHGVAVWTHPIHHATRSRPQARPYRRHPRRAAYGARDELIAALADALIVVEADEGAGALLCVDRACELGREVGVVPGRATDATARASNRLLREGASPILDAQDAMALLPRPASTARGDLVGVQK